MSTGSENQIRTACYCRVSSEEEELLNSLENQVLHYTNYVENRPDLKLVGLYIDKGKSGRSKEKRAGFLRLLRHCEEGRIDLIITKSVSRFSRNTQDFIEVVMDLKEKCIEVYFENENLYTTSPNSTFILSTLAAMAQEEIRNTSQNIEWAWEKRTSQGKPRFKKILGYHMERVNDERHITINEKEAEIIREIFALANEGVRASAIARRMTEKGYVTNRGATEWTHSTVKSILTNISYTGNMLSGRVIQTDFLSNQKKRNTGERNQYFIENHHPAIISQELFNAVQQRLESQKGTGSVKRDATNLSGRVLCGVCGSKCYRTSESWLCKRAKANPSVCEGFPIREKEIKEAMHKALKQRYDLSGHAVALRLMGELKRTNDLHFEYHRLSMIYKLEAAKQRERQANDDKTYKQEEARENIEKEIVEKEELWQQVEEDRDYRHHAISILSDPTNVDDDFSFEFMRALFVKVLINPTFEFILTWFDGTQTTIALTNCSAKGRKLSKRMKKGEESLTDTLIEAKVNSMNAVKQPPESKRTHVLSRTSNLSVQELTKNIDQSPIFLEQTSPAKKKKRVCCYARVSSRDEDSFSSFEFQIVHYTYFIHKNPEWEFAGIYADRGISGTSTNRRTNFNKMIADCIAGKIDKIITKSISRFSRNVIDCIEISRTLKSLPNPVEIYFEKENISTLDEKSELLLTILSTIAQEEARNVSENIKWGNRKLIERGKYNLPAYRFYGYNTDEQGNWVVDEEQAAVIRTIYDGYLNGKSTKSIARELTEKGVLSPRGLKAWNANTVDHLLRSETVSGTIRYQKTYSKDYLGKKQVKNQGELPQYMIEDHHPSIIEPEVFEKVQQEIKRREIGRNNQKKYPHQTAFFKLFYCGKCGNLMNHVAYSSKNTDGTKAVRHYWRCTVALGHKFTTECDAQGYREEMIEMTFMNMLHEMKEHPQLIYETKHAIQEVGLSEAEQEQMEELKQKVKDYYYVLYKEVEAKRGNEDFDVNSFEIKQITDKIIAIENELEGYNERLEKVKQMQEDLEWLLNELRDLKKYQLRRREATFRDDIFSRLIKRGEVHEDGRIVYDLCLGFPWTAYDNDQALPRRSASKKNKKK